MPTPVAITLIICITVLLLIFGLATLGTLGHRKDKQAETESLRAFTNAFTPRDTERDTTQSHTEHDQ